VRRAPRRHGRSQYKDYVLFMLFIKYITDKYGNSADFAPPVTIPKGASCKDMLDLRGKSDIGDKINTHLRQAATRFLAETRRARRHPWRRVRVPDAALRHREWQEQGTVLIIPKVAGSNPAPATKFSTVGS